MKKKFILWLCRTLKVDLVEPIQTKHQVKLVHKFVEYKLVQDIVSLQKDYLTPPYMDTIRMTKREMVLRCAEQMMREELITWSEYEDPIQRALKIKCSFYVAPSKSIN